MHSRLDSNQDDFLNGEASYRWMTRVYVDMLRSDLRYWQCWRLSSRTLPLKSNFMPRVARLGIEPKLRVYEAPVLASTLSRKRIISRN